MVDLTGNKMLKAVYTVKLADMPYKYPRAYMFNAPILIDARELIWRIH